jgi:hypothetical protein
VEKIMSKSSKSAILAVALGLSLSSCGVATSISTSKSGSSAGSLGGGNQQTTVEPEDDISKSANDRAKAKAVRKNGKLGDLFASTRTNEVGAVNKYLWHAALDVLSFLPIEAADPFSGIIAFGNGRAPGSSQVYRATVFITDPALDARSLKVSVTTSRGAASAQTQREIENAILSRARQLRISRAKL